MIKVPLWMTASPGGVSQQLGACPLQSSSWHRQGPGRSLRLLLLPCLLVLFLTLSTSAVSADVLRVIVMFRDGTPTRVQQKLITQSRGRVVAWFPVVNAVALELPTGPLLGTLTSLPNALGLGSLLPATVSIVETAFSLLSDHLGLEIEALEVDFYISLHDRPGDAPTSLVTPLHPLPLEGGYRWNLRQIALDEVDRQVQGQGVHIAVLDTGIDASHPLLAGRVGNSYNARVGEDTTQYVDRNGHGTHVAGIIAAAAGAPHASAVMRGIAPGVTLHAVRVLDADGGGYLTDLISGLVWVYQQPHIRVVNMSLGSTNSSKVVEKIIKKLYDAGVVMVASAGNCSVTVTSGTGGDGEGGDGEGGDGEGGDGEGGDGEGGDQGCQQREIKYPAAYWRTIAVGATDVDARVAYYSVTGPHVDIVAPGGTRQRGQVVSTNSTVRAGVASAAASAADGNSLAANGEGGDGEGGDGEGGDGTTGGGTGLYALGRGTSQAAPHVTGVVALMRSANPRLTPAQVQTILQETAVDLGAPAAAQGAGLIDAARAVQRAKSLR